MTWLQCVSWLRVIRLCWTLLFAAFSGVAKRQTIGRPTWISEVRERRMKSAMGPFPMDEITQFCHRWKIRELAVFGSVLRADFDSESDIDVIVSFNNDADWSLLDHIRMQQELQMIFRRDVDLVTKRAVERSQNWLRRKEILSTASVIFSEDRAACETR